MKRTAVILAFLLAMGAGTFAQYAYSSTGVAQTLGTLYASTYVEVDYLTANYYSVATWNELMRLAATIAASTLRTRSPQDGLTGPALQRGCGTGR